MGDMPDDVLEGSEEQEVTTEEPVVVRRRSLANTYRPRLFREVVGQRQIIQILKKSVIKGEIYPSYLFSGPWGTGKTTLARILAKRLLCLAPLAEDPCDTCESCVAFDRGNNDNYLEIDAATHSGVGDIKKIQEFASRVGWGRSLYKVIVLDESHDISQAGQDKLLKSLEEAREGLVFMFCTTAGEAMLETVRSRSIVFDLHPPSLEEVVSRLEDIAASEKIVFEDKALRLVASQSDLHLRDAIKDLEVLASFSSEVTHAVALDYYGLDDAEQALQFLRDLSLSGKSGKASLDHLKAAMEVAYRISVRRGVGHFLKLLETVLADLYRAGFGHHKDMRVLDPNRNRDDINFISRQMGRKMAMVSRFIRECRRSSPDFDGLHANVMYMHLMVLQDIVFRSTAAESVEDRIALNVSLDRTHEDLARDSKNYEFLASQARKQPLDPGSIPKEEEALEVLSEEDFVDGLWREEKEQAPSSEGESSKEVPPPGDQSSGDGEDDDIDLDDLELDGLVSEEAPTVDVGNSSAERTPKDSESFGSDSFFNPEP